MSLPAMIGLLALACAVGAWLTRSADADRPTPLLAALCSGGGAVGVAAMILAAESSSEVAHDLGLAAAFVAAAVTTAGFALALRLLTGGDRR